MDLKRLFQRKVKLNCIDGSAVSRELLKRDKCVIDFPKTTISREVLLDRYWWHLTKVWAGKLIDGIATKKVMVGVDFGEEDTMTVVKVRRLPNGMSIVESVEHVDRAGRKS